MFILFFYHYKTILTILLKYNIFSGFFNFPKLPDKNNIGPRDQYLKPGFEKINPSDEKADKDLDKQ